MGQGHGPVRLRADLPGPLAAEAGGYGVCRQGKQEAAAPTGRPVFADANDPDYQAILAMCREGKRHLEQIKRFDMPGFVPPAAYVREMKRYGVVPQDVPEGVAIDVYQTDRRYWESLWYIPSEHIEAREKYPPDTKSGL